MIEPRTIYIGSLWHEFCDPFVTVAGYDQDQVQAKLNELEVDEYILLCDQAIAADNIDDDDVYNDIMTGGVFAETVLDDFIEPSELEWRMAELAEDGITVF